MEDKKSKQDITEPKRRKSRVFSSEFKKEAIILADRTGNSRAAKDLGINESSIRTWRKKLNPTSLDLIKGKNKKSYADLEKENRRLKKELGWMEEINKVLKKSTAIFSSDQIKRSDS